MQWLFSKEDKWFITFLKVVFSLPSHDYSEELEQPNRIKKIKDVKKTDQLEQSEQLDDYYH